MNISAWSIRNPVPVLLLFAFLTLLGAASFQKLHVQNFPDIELPIVSVALELEGATPGQMETEVARKVEARLSGMEGVEHVWSTLSEGTATVSVSFSLDKDPDTALDEVRNVVEGLRAELPADTRPPVVAKTTTAGKPVATFVVSAPGMGETALSWFVDSDVNKVLTGVAGVGRVVRLGGVNREIMVAVDPVRLAALNIGVDDVASALQQVQREDSGGQGHVGGARQAVRTQATVSNAAALSDLSLPLPTGETLRIGDVATVTDSISERGNAAQLNGAPVVAIQVLRTRGASEVEVASRSRAALAKLQETQPGLNFKEVFNSTDAILDNYHGSMQLLYEGAFLTLVVVWLFLRDGRTTLVAASALPMSIIPVFAAMSYMGFSLNTLTLLATALVVGILVDDAIVEVENIVRHQRMGKTPYEAATDATEEIGLAVIATSLTLVAVFLPTAFMGGIPGKFFVQFGWTTAIAVLASLLVARMLTPMLAAYFLRSHNLPPEPGWVIRYMGVVDWCLVHRKTTMLLALAFFAGSLTLLPFLPKGFVPAADQGQISVKLELQPGSTLAQTSEAAVSAYQRIKHIPEVVDVFADVGSNGGWGTFNMDAGTDQRKASLTVVLVNRKDRDTSQAQVEQLLRESLAVLPGVRVSVGGGGDADRIEIALAGDDAAALALTSQLVETELRQLPGVGGITSDVSLQMQEVMIQPDTAKAAELGVTTAALARAVRLATAGDYSGGLSKLSLPARQVPIRVRLNDAAISDLAAISQLQVRGREGLVPVSMVATVGLTSGAAQINRYDRNRYVTLWVEPGSRQLGAVLEEVNALPSLNRLPPGVTRLDFGEAERITELFSSFSEAMLLGVLVVYAVLVLLFRDFTQPVTVLVALPLSLGGAVVALLLGGYAFSMPAILGMLMLMGIVTKNSILLVEYAITARRGGVPRADAIRDACRMRARPIVMTSIAMIAGMLPLALGLGAEPSFRAPMATEVIGGLLTSTVLSLLVVPVVFTYADDFQNYIAARLTNRKKR